MHEFTKQTLCVTDIMSVNYTLSDLAQILIVELSSVN